MNRIIFSLAIKNLTKNKAFSLINIIGLSIGIAAFTLIVFYVSRESSYDNFHLDKDKIYRVESQFRSNGVITQDIATSSFGYAPAMMDEFPEIESVCRINLFNHEKDIRYNARVEREAHVFMVDSNFFSFFSYPLIRGDANQVLAKPDFLVISKKAALRYFKNEDPIGKTLEIKDQNSVQNYTVTGVFDDISSVSNVKFDFLLAYDYSNNFLNNFWYMHEAYLYVKVPEIAAVSRIENAFPAMAEKYKVYDAMKDQKWEVKLVPLTQIHLNEPKPYELEQKGNSRSLSFLLGMAILILLIAWINFINLSTVMILEKRSHFDIMRAQGASKYHIFIQFIANALVINLIALFTSIIFIIVSIDFLNISVPIFQQNIFWSSRLVWTIISGVFIAGVSVTGILPGLTIPIFKEKDKLKNNQLLLRKIFVISQYSFAVILIISSITIKKQLHFMEDQELGVDINNVLVFKTPTNTDNYQQKIQSFRDELQRISGVENIAISSAVPGQQVGYMGSHKRADALIGDDRLFEMLRVDANFINLYHLNLVKGRNFRKNYQPDYQSVIINEEAVKWFGFANNSEAIGKTVNLEGSGNTPFTILGILDNYHQQSLKIDYTPVMYVMGNDSYWIPMKYFSVKSTADNKRKLVAESCEIFKKYFPNASFDYFFSDQYFNLQYANDKQFSAFFMALSWISILIVCIGILGLSGFIMAMRTKEIGVRKVNGAKIREILYLLNKDFAKWVFISFIVGSPIAYFAMKQWLQSFAFKSEINWWVFALAGFIALAIALLTVSWQTFRAARRNPIEALRYE